MPKNKKPVLLLMTLLLASCGNSFPYGDKSVSVVLIDGEHYQVVNHNQEKDSTNLNVARLKDSDSVNYTVQVDNNYYVSGVSYEDSRVFFIGNSQYSVTLNHVKYNTRVTVFVEPINGESGESGPIDESDNIITYDTNGGEYILSDGLPMNKVVYSTLHHPRPNTSIGTDIMKRDGYTQIGWNTKADLSGEHIGLGSRYLDLNNHTFTLYAEWSKYSNLNEFEYHLNVDQYIVDKYIGTSKEVSIPEYIDNMPVTTIGEKAFFETSVETVVLPKSISKVEQLAFGRCSIKEIYFYDNLVEIEDGCFVESNNLSTIHINAIITPKYVTLDRNVTYADKIDNLIVNQGKKKIIILGGSGAFYNVDACVLKKLYPDYEPFNVAVNGWFNNFIQLDVINRFVEDGDVFLHVVESCGRFQFMTTNVMGEYTDNIGYDSRFINCLELNYDLLSYCDMRNVTHFFDVFHKFNKGRERVTPKKYTDYTLYADERGDYSSDSEIRNNVQPFPTMSSLDGKTQIRDLSISQEGAVDRTCYSRAGMSVLCDYYQRFIDKGLKIYFAFACLAKESLLAADKTPENIALYEQEVRGYLSSKATIINSMDDVLLPIEQFSNTDWHLKYEPAVEQTIILANKMGAL